MLKRLFYFFLLAPNFIMAQSNNDFTPQQDSVVQVIKNFFDGMRASDSTMVRNTCFPGVTLHTATYSKENETILKQGDMEQFIKAVGAPKEAIYDERIYSYEVKIEEPLASVWTEYSFFLGEKFSHCGVNNFQLIRTKKGWKVISIVDTRKKTDCKNQ